MFSKLKDKNIRIFFVFLSLSFGIWLLMEFTKEAVSKVVFKVDYINMPPYKMFKNKPITELEAIVKGTGFTLLEYKLTKKTLEFDLSKIDVKGQGIVPTQYLEQLNMQLKGVTLLSVISDSIPVILGNRMVKKVPVKLNQNIGYKLGYHLVGDFVISPDSIMISGVESDISKIEEVYTDLFKKKQVYKDIDEDISILQEVKNASYSQLEVNIKGTVDKTTEGKLKIPVRFINVPKGVKVIPFPKEVLVTYQTNLSNYKKVDRESIQIVYDYNNYLKDTDLKYMNPVIVKKSEWISSLKITPEQIEFLIQK